MKSPDGSGGEGSLTAEEYRDLWEYAATMTNEMVREVFAENMNDDEHEEEEGKPDAGKEAQPEEKDAKVMPVAEVMRFMYTGERP